MENTILYTGIITPSREGFSHFVKNDLTGDPKDPRYVHIQVVDDLRDMRFEAIYLGFRTLDTPFINQLCTEAKRRLVPIKPGL